MVYSTTRSKKATKDVSDDDAPPFQLATSPGFQVSHIPEGNLVFTLLLLRSNSVGIKNVDVVVVVFRKTKLFIPAAGRFSRSRLRGTQGGRLYTTVQVWIQAGLRGACSGRSKSRNLASKQRDRFPMRLRQSGSWKPPKFLHGERRKDAAVAFASAVSLSAAAVRIGHAPYSRLSRCTPRTEHGSYCLPPSVWLHSKLIPLWQALCVRHGTLSRTPAQFQQQRADCAANFCFPTISLEGKDAAATLSPLHPYLQQLHDSGTAHTPDTTVSPCSSHQTRPITNASLRPFGCTRKRKFLLQR